MTETKRFPRRPSGEELGNIVAEMQEAFDAKTTSNALSGQRQYREGTMKPFQGFSPEVFARRYEVSLHYDDPSTQEITERVVQPLLHLAAAHNIQGIWAGVGDFAPHTTLQIADFPLGTDPSEQQKKIDFLNSQYSHLQMIAKVLTGKEAVFDQLVLAGSFMYICTGAVARGQRTQDAVYGLQRTREVIEAIYRRGETYGNFGDDPVTPTISLAVPERTGTYYNIVHCSVGRMTAPATPEQLTAFSQEVYEQIGKPLQQNPVIAKVSDVLVGTSYDHAIQRNPDIFT